MSQYFPSRPKSVNKHFSYDQVEDGASEYKGIFVQVMTMGEKQMLFEQ